ncbi:hypothetical protein F4810DRAFT_716275 [Camillea tinctor]|nr:hypothetical protein F4810DRAFT_716275 [Camillea tinctor]
MSTGAEHDTPPRSEANEGSDHINEQQTKRAKRRKYAVKACYECRKRKIRCDGESPCFPCLSRKRNCMIRERHDAPPTREYEAGPAEPSLSRIRDFGEEGYVEQQMKAVMKNSSGNPSVAEMYETSADLTDTATTESASPGGYTNVDSEDARTFVGDTSSLNALRRIESQLDDLGVQIRPDSPLSSTRPLTPRQNSARNVNDGKNQRGSLQSILVAYGIVPDQAEWDTFLRIYLDEIHGIYPFLHPPSMQQTYAYLWDRSFVVLPDDLERHKEVDNDVRSPFNVSDDWLGRQKSTTATVEELGDEIKAQASITHNTTIPYLEATISYSKIAGDAWKAVYGVDTVAHNGPNFICDYLDILLESWSQKLPPGLRYEANVPYEDQFASSEWWQMKECLFNHMRCTFLKLLIRRPVASSTSPSSRVHQDIANEVISAQLACSIIEVFERIPMKYPKYCIGFMNYIISSTIILFSIAVRNPGFKEIYKERILYAMQSIMTYCQKTWVSGKTIRAASKLNKMVQSIFGSLSNGDHGKRSGRRDEQDGRMYNIYISHNEGNEPATMRSTPMRALELHWPLHGRSAPPDSLAAQHKSNPSLMSNSSTITNGSTRSSRTQSSRIHVPFPSSVDSAPPEFSSSAEARVHKELPRPTDMLSTSEYIPEAPIMWPPMSPDSEIIGFPGLPMVDFDFEQSFGFARSRLTPLPGSNLTELDNLE